MREELIEEAMKMRTDENKNNAVKTDTIPSIITKPSIILTG